MKNMKKCRTSISSRSSRIRYRFLLFALELEFEPIPEFDRDMLASSLLGDVGDWGDEGAIGNWAFDRIILFLYYVCILYISDVARY